MSIQGGKFLTFSLAKEEYGLTIDRVKEIIGMMEITPVPNSPRFIRGVINLRGKIIPVMDLHAKFQSGEGNYHDRTCIIVVESAKGSAAELKGLIVDSVSEVVTVSEADIEPAVQEDNGIEYIMGLGKIKGKVVLLLNLASVLSN